MQTFPPSPCESLCHIHSFSSPLGNIILAGDGRALTGLWFEGQKYFGSTLSNIRTDQCFPVLLQAKEWLHLYFQGKDPGFTPLLSMKGTPFQVDVWKILLSIPFGETITYGEIAARLAVKRGLPRMSAQAVGSAVAHNPISLIIPCHRVIGADGGLCGYAAGLARKAWLLEMEKKAVSFDDSCLQQRDHHGTST